MIAKDFIVFKTGVIIYDIKNTKVAVNGVKVGKIGFFESIGLSQTITIEYDHINKMWGTVFPRINYRKNTEEMALFQKCEVLCQEIGNIFEENTLI